MPNERAAAVSMSRMPPWPPQRRAAAVPAVLYTRAPCPLCDDLVRALDATGLAGRLALEAVDVDGDRELKKRYGLRVPVLVIDGEVCAEGRVEPAQLARAVRARLRGGAR